jgi:hypothetical protein
MARNATYRGTNDVLADLGYADLDEVAAETLLTKKPTTSSPPVSPLLHRRGPRRCAP